MSQNDDQNRDRDQEDPVESYRDSNSDRTREGRASSEETQRDSSPVQNESDDEDIDETDEDRDDDDRIDGGSNRRRSIS